MLEYLFVVGVFISIIAILAVFLYTFKEHSDRVINLVASDYP